MASTLNGKMTPIFSDYINSSRNIRGGSWCKPTGGNDLLLLDREEGTREIGGRDRVGREGVISLLRERGL
jgi:hypothetical protein